MTVHAGLKSHRQTGEAVFIKSFGGPEDLPDPVAAPGEVVIDVVAASVNAADWKARAGQIPNRSFP